MEEIQKDKTLTSLQKMKKIQEEVRKRIKNKCNFNRECTHYKKKCSQFFFSCCQIHDPCRRCHLERNICQEPILDTIQCNQCLTIQKPSSSCIFCFIPFSKYYCDICSIWTDLDDVYHCLDCGICRKGTKETTFHCDTCQTCFHQKFFHSHQCFQTSYKEKKCLLCHEDLFSSQEESFSIPCSHFIHMKCFKEYISYGNFTCPQCKKTLYDMTEEWNYRRKMIQEHPLTDEIISIKEGSIVPSLFGKFKIIKIEKGNYKGEFIDWVLKDGIFAKGYLSSIIKKPYILIYCNDCLKKSYTQYHHYGLECNHCFSFNTQE